MYLNTFIHIHIYTVTYKHILLHAYMHTYKYISGWIHLVWLVYLCNTDHLVQIIYQTAHPWRRVILFSVGINSPLIFCHWEQSGQELKVGIWRWELKQKPWRNAACQLAPHILLSLLSYTVKTQLSRTGSTHGRVDPSTSITNQDVKQICLRK